MNRSALDAAVAARTGLSTAQASSAVGAALAAIGEALVQGDSVALPGFGTFEARSRAAREGRNPRTGETLTIAATVVPAFKPAAGLKRAVAGD